MSAAQSAAVATTGSDMRDVLGPLRPRVLQLPGSSSYTDDGRQILLRNFGGKPLKLRAELLAEGGSRTEGATHWHEIAFYRTDAGQIAVALRLLRTVAGDLGVHRARVFPDMDAASTWLEQFDCSADLGADFDVADCRLSTASITLQAAALRERTDRLERAYRGLVGEILFRLEADS